MSSGCGAPDFPAEQRTEIKEAFALLYRRGLNTTQALAAARERSWGAEAQAFFDFVAAAKKRGICDFLGTRGGGSGGGGSGNELMDGGLMGPKFRGFAAIL